MVRRALAGLVDKHPLKRMTERSKMILVIFAFTFQWLNLSRRNAFHGSATLKQLSQARSFG